jgi:putative transposase
VLLRDQWRGWDHFEVLLSLAHRLVRCLVGLLAVLVRSDLSKDTELVAQHLPLRAETAVGTTAREHHAATLRIPGR